LSLGPGAYQTDTLKNEQRFTIGVKREKSERNNLPGPGHYSPRKADPYVRKSAASINFKEKSRRPV
jgi:Sperm-tail PG-rich repeat